MAERTVRTRRSPEAARAHILDAADRVFTRALPDAVGLREIAEEAGISHGLVSHYFATYDNLVEQVISRRLDVARDAAFTRLATMTFSGDDEPLLAILLDLLSDKALVRLIAWSFLTGRGSAIVGQRGKLARLIDGMHARIVARKLGNPKRNKLEFSAMAAIAMVAGWSLIGDPLANSLGREPIERADLQRELQRMLRAYVTSDG